MGYFANIRFIEQGSDNLKLPWDSKYLKISFHVVFTVIIIYVLMLITDGFAFVISDLRGMAVKVGQFFGGLLGLFSPLIIALVIAYLLDPPADFFQKHYEKFMQTRLAPLSEKRGWDRFGKRLHWIREKRGRQPSPHKKRTAGAALTYLSILLVLGVLIGVVIGRMGSSESILEYLGASITNTVNEASRLLTNLQNKLEEYGLYSYLSKYWGNVSDSVDEIVTNMGQNVIRGATSIGSGVLNFFISLVVAFYIIKDKAHLLHSTRDLMDTFFPKRFNRIVRNLAGDFHAVFSGYIRSQMLDAIFVGFAVGAGLYVMGSKLALFIGVLTGFLALIPYFGGTFAFVIAIVLELLLATPVQAVKSGAAILILQQIDSMLVQPRIVGDKVDLSPPVVMLSLTIAGSVFGVWGMVLAVPVCAVIKIFFTRFVRRYKERNAAESPQPNPERSNT